MTWLLVAAGAALGAPARFLTDRWISERHDAAFPWGTFTVNVVGSFFFGLLSGVALREAPYALLGTGFCGAFTTFSTFAYETDRLLQDGARGLAAANAIFSVLACLAVAALGWAMGSAL